MDKVEEYENKQVAIITNVDLGFIDHTGLAYSITFAIDRVGSVFHHFQNLKELGDMITDAGVSKIDELKGKPCYMIKNEHDTWVFLEMWKVL